MPTEVERCLEEIMGKEKATARTQETGILEIDASDAEELNDDRQPLPVELTVYFSNGNPYLTAQTRDGAFTSAVAHYVPQYILETEKAGRTIPAGIVKALKDNKYQALLKSFYGEEGRDYILKHAQRLMTRSMVPIMPPERKAADAQGYSQARCC